MVVSLYVCEIPRNVLKEDIEGLFKELEGYRETRVKITNDKRTIAFIDYDTEKVAKFAMETLQNFKFSEGDKGIIIKISDNTKGGQQQESKQIDKSFKFTNRKRPRRESFSERSEGKSEQGRGRPQRKNDEDSANISNNPVQNNNTNILELFNLLSSQMGVTNPDISNKLYTFNDNINGVPGHSGVARMNNQSDSSGTNPFSNLLDTIQAVQLLQTLANPNLSTSTHDKANLGNLTKKSTLQSNATSTFKKLHQIT